MLVFCLVLAGRNTEAAFQTTPIPVGAFMISACNVNLAYARTKTGIAPAIKLAMI